MIRTRIPSRLSRTWFNLYVVFLGVGVELAYMRNGATVSAWGQLPFVLSLRVSGTNCLLRLFQHLLVHIILKCWNESRLQFTTRNATPFCFRLWGVFCLRRQLLQDGTTRSDVVEAIVVQADGTVILGGFTFGNWSGLGSGLSDFALVALDAGGEEVWRWQVTRQKQ